MTSIRFRPAAGLLLLAAMLLAFAAPAAARTHHRSRHAARAGRARPAGNLRVVVLPGGPEDPPLPAYYTVRVLDSYGGKWESRPDADGLAEFAGVPPGRTIVSSWSASSDSVVTTSRRDTLWIEKGRVTVDTLRLELLNGRHASR